MDKDVSAGGTTTIVGRLALGVTLLAFGLGATKVIDGVTTADAVSLAHYVGGVALFVAGLLAFRARDAATGTAFSALGALWFTWAATAGSQMSDHAAGLFLLLFALATLSLTLGASGGLLDQGTYGLLCAALLLLAIGRFAGNDALGRVGGWFAVAAGAVAWYAATAALAHWPTALPRRAAGRGVTAAG